MRYTLLLLLTVTSLLACKRFASKPQHLPRATMQHLLMDIHEAEIYSTLVKKDTSQHSNPSKNIDSLARYYKEIFAHYSIDTTQFQQSLQWYRAHPEELDSIYVNMLPALDTLK